MLIILSVSCGKKDIKKNVTVSGNVRNNCTGGPFAGVKVKFTTVHDKSLGKSQSSNLITLTDNNGNFSFTNLEINSNSDYKYFISIDTYSNYDYEFLGISPQELDKNQISTPYQIGVSATFKLLNFYLPTGVTINSPDSFSLKLQQRVYHSYEPNNIWEINYFSFNGISYLNNSAAHSGNRMMGWWHVTLNKTKSGVSSTIYDSVFVDIGGTSTYTIPW